ncbi:MAG: dihydropteroate synthase [Firmicutes bacterium]|nr:dihydropteroate synthase [Bacillota bacterium]
MKIGGKEFNDRTYIMGILNVTDNSFSDGGKYNTLDAALAHTEEMIAEGADIIDVGGESTHPGYTMISDEEEIARVAPVIERIKSEFDIPVSVDTYKSRVCEAAARAGADMINDIWGFLRDKDMAKTAAKYNMAACLMHNKREAVYTDFVNEVVESLNESVKIARAAGVTEIAVDPGVGFAKSCEQNLEIIKEVARLKETGCPVLLGTSRKSVIGLTLNLPADERVEGTLATSVYAVLNGCRFVRVHDVKENKRAIAMTERIMGI